MRIKGLKSFVLAAGLAMAAPAMAQTAAPVAQPGAAEPAAPAAPATAAETPAAPAPAVADPTLNPDGSRRILARDGIGQPTDRALGVQYQATDLGDQAAWFHNVILLPVITVISLFVLGLLVWVVVRYRRAANPTPSKTSHNTMIEIIWTAAPVVILALIAIPSIRLLAQQYDPAPDNAVTLKAIGNQWYWIHEYPDHGGISITSNMLKDADDPSLAAGQRARTDADGPRLLAVDNRIVLPVGTPIRLVTTANDVIHSWAMPAFWTKLDAVPGRLNETSFTIREPGLYFGQCSELCGVRHAYMPIAIEAVSPAVFAQWIRSKGGTMPGEGAAPAAGVPAGASGSVPTQPGDDDADDTATPANATAGETFPATDQSTTTNQAATANDGGLGQVSQ